MAAPETLSFLSLNVGSNYNLAGLNTVISTANYDVILLQEIKMTQGQLDMAINRYGFLSKVNISEEDQHKPGTALLWKTSIPLSGVVNLVEGKLLAESVDSPDSPSCESREYVPSARKKYRMEVVHVLTCGKGFCRVIPAMTFYQKVKKGFFG